MHNHPPDAPAWGRPLSLWLAFIDVTTDRGSYAGVAKILQRDEVFKRFEIKDPNMTEIY